MNNSNSNGNGNGNGKGAPPIKRLKLDFASNNNSGIGPPPSIHRSIFANIRKVPASSGAKATSELESAIRAGNIESVRALVKGDPNSIDFDAFEAAHELANEDTKRSILALLRVYEERLNTISNNFDSNLYNPRAMVVRNAAKSRYTIRNSAKNGPAHAMSADVYSLRNEPVYHIYNKDDFPEAPDGVYLWIYSAFSGFFAIRVYSVAELGTKHVAIVKRVRKAGVEFRLSYAGELRKTGPEVAINLLSGTYSEPFMKPKITRNRLDMVDYNRFRAERAAEMLNKAVGGVAFRVAESPMETMIRNDVGEEEKARLEARGFVFSEKSSRGGGSGGSGGERRRRHKTRRKQSRKHYI